MNRIASQFEHTIQLLMKTLLETKLDKLQLLNVDDALEIVQWSKNIPETIKNCTRDIFNIDAMGGCSNWIVNLQNTTNLVPISGVGEILIEGSSNETNTAVSSIPTHSWVSRSGNHFYRTGYLAKYNSDGSIFLVGKLENRVKLGGGQKVQLEALENAIVTCSKVREVVNSVKISAGRSQLIAVVCLVESQSPQITVLQEVLDEFAELVE